jgi:hypothetical protein
MSTLRADTLTNVAASKSVPMATVVDGVAKAWVNFNGTGTPAINAAFNVSTITDGGVGNYTINFTSALSDANFTVSALNNSPTNTPGATVVNTRATTSCQILTFDRAGTAVDPTLIHAIFFR